MARVYIEQFGAFWSLSTGAAEKFLNNPDWEDGWDLDDYGRRLKSRPSCIRKSVDKRAGTSYWNSSNHHLFFSMPCDWNDYELEEAKKKLKEFRRGRE